jgi:cellulose biosynthesis protein BcsQ
VLATYNIKGGVGKTSTAVNLAYVAAEQGASVLLCDLDPQAASTYLFRVRPNVKGGGRGLLRLRRAAGEAIKATDYERLDLLPADFSYRHLDLALGDFKKPAARLKKVLAPLRHEYDYIILDCAPSISLVSESVFAAANALLVPVVPARLSARVYDQLSELAQHGRVGDRAHPRARRDRDPRGGNPGGGRDRADGRAPQPGRGLRAREPGCRLLPGALVRSPGTARWTLGTVAMTESNV